MAPARAAAVAPSSVFSSPASTGSRPTSRSTCTALSTARSEKAEEPSEEAANASGGDWDGEFNPIGSATHDNTETMFALAFSNHDSPEGVSYNGKLLLAQGVFFVFFGVAGFFMPSVWESTVAEEFTTLQGKSWLMMTSFYMAFVGILYIAGGLQDSVRFTCQVVASPGPYCRIRQ